MADDAEGRPRSHRDVLPGGSANGAVTHEARGPAVRTVLLAAPRAFCAGVERAIEIVERALAMHGPPVYVRRQIVHNRHVVEALEAKGAIFVHELDEIPDSAVTVYSAHGVAPAVRHEAERRNLPVIDATCPLVAKVHSEARRFARRGDTIALIGTRGHDEVEGTYGEAPAQTVVVESSAEAAELTATGQVSYLMETTLAVDEAAQIVEVLRERFPDLDGPRVEDICYATTNRQRAVLAVAAESDVVLVVGSKNSANSNHLVDSVRRQGTAAYLIDEASEILSEWIRDARVIGLSAGASAPPALVEQVLDALRADGPIEISERTVATETVGFTLPKELRGA